MNRIAVSLWLVALAVPLLVVLAGNWLFWAATGRPERFLEEPDAIAMQLVLAAGPFVALAGFASTRANAQDRSMTRGLATAAAVGAVVAAGMWGAFYYGGYVYWRDRATGGANIGLGLLMLASPLVVGAAMAIAYRFSRTRPALAR